MKQNNNTNLVFLSWDLGASFSCVLVSIFFYLIENNDGQNGTSSNISHFAHSCNTYMMCDLLLAINFTLYHPCIDELNLGIL